MENTQKALLIGASGLVGSQCLQLLLTDSDFTHVEIWVRKSLKIDHPKLVEHIVDFSESESFFPIKANVVFCCLGTTINKAGSKSAFREVDFWNVLRIAKKARETEVPKFLVISSIGANAQSKNFYLRTKGEIENALSELSFANLHIFRPSILLGKRNEFRLAELIGKYFMKAIKIFLIGNAQKYRAIEASTVASAMIKASKQMLDGVNIWESDAIENLSV